MGKGFFILLHLGMKSLKIALMLSIMFIASALSPVPAKALQNQDSITLAQPVFTGAENSKPDSILAVADAVPENQAQIKDLLIDTAAQIEAMPGKDATPTEWATWIAGAIAVVIAIWQYIKAGKYKAELNKKQGYTSG